MNIMQIGILVFIIIESSNVLMMYFAPEQKNGNGVGVFNVWHRDHDDELKDFLNYMTSWVAGTKLIFILMGLVIVIWGTPIVQAATAAALVVSIASFFFRLYPIIKRMDSKDQITPKGYSKILLVMILIFIVAFAVICTVGLVQYL